MKVCFLLNDVSLSGGVGVILEHAHRLDADHGFDVTLALDRQDGGWTYERLEGLTVLPLQEAVNDRYDVAVATWWRTAYDLFELSADRYAYFVQSFEDRFYPDEVDRLQAALTHDLPVSFVTEASWIAETLRELRPGVRCHYVRNGIDKDVFRPVSQVEPHLEGPLRVLVEGDPDVWFKAVGEALAVTHEMTQERVVTYVTPRRIDASELGVDRVVGPLRPREMAALYAETDVVLKLARVEGMFGPPLEGFHMGATCVVTPVTGHDEYVVHGWNGVIAGWDDTRGAARWLDVLARDRRLLHFLRRNAVATAEAWPSWGQSSMFMAAVLRRIRRDPGGGGDGFAQALNDVKAGTESLRTERLMLEHLVHERDAVTAATAARHDALTATRAYRYAVALREHVWKHPLVRAITFPVRMVRRLVGRGGGAPPASR